MLWCDMIQQFRPKLDWKAECAQLNLAHATKSKSKTYKGGGNNLWNRWVLGLKSGLKGRGSDRWWERRWWLWWSRWRAACKVRWTRKRVNKMRLTGQKRERTFIENVLSEWNVPKLCSWCHFWLNGGTHKIMQMFQDRDRNLIEIWQNPIDGKTSHQGYRRSLMPAVAPSKIGVDWWWCLGTARLASSRHGFRSSPAFEGSSANDEIGRCSDVAMYIDKFKCSHRIKNIHRDKRWK